MTTMTNFCIKPELIINHSFSLDDKERPTGLFKACNQSHQNLSLGTVLLPAHVSALTSGPSVNPQTPGKCPS